MAHILDRILATKRLEVEAGRRARPMAQIEREALEASAPRGFASALQDRVKSGRPAVIAEFKRASPSRGVIGQPLDPAAIAASYERAGAACLSVLTDREYFSGSANDLVAARGAVALPVLRKDFVIDPWQVYEARAMGADCILLIVDTASPENLKGLEDLARKLGMDVLVECHDGRQLEIALGLATPLVGINNRDLRTFEVRLETTLEFASRVPQGKLVIAESGIGSPEDVLRLRNGGVSAYLVGSALMESGDPGGAFSRLFGQKVMD